MTRDELTAWATRNGWKLDRWGRSVTDSLASIALLQAQKIRWVAVTQNLDSDENNPMSRFMLHIMAAFAELEREMIRERVKSGMKAAKHRGAKFGRPAKVFDRRKASEMHAKGASVREIAAAFKVGSSTVMRLLKAATQ